MNLTVGLGAYSYAKQILMDYKTYVDSDKNIEEDTKRIRKQTADEFFDLIVELERRFVRET